MKKIKMVCLIFAIILCSGCTSSNVRQESKAKVQKAKEESAEKQETQEAKKTTGKAGEAEKKEAAKKADLEQAAQETSAAASKLIVIDPGHSAVVAEGSEPLGPGSQEYKAADTSGTCGTTTGIPEYELTLAVSGKLKIKLEEKGYQVILTRETNEVPLSCIQRADVANQSKADAFIRIHANGSEDADASGAMTICTTPSSPYAPGLYSRSRALSDAVITNLCRVAGCENDGVWETDSMSGNNWSQVPVTIVEMGYMTNPKEDGLMAEDGYRDRIAEGIAEGTDEFLRNLL